jgi:hypothetical protein
MRLLAIILLLAGCVSAAADGRTGDTAQPGPKWKLTVTILDKDGDRLDKLARQDMESGGVMEYDTRAECEAFMATQTFAEERTAIASMVSERFSEGSTEAFACEPIPAPAENI